MKQETNLFSGFNLSNTQAPSQPLPQTQAPMSGFSFINKEKPLHQDSEEQKANVKMTIRSVQNEEEDSTIGQQQF